MLTCREITERASEHLGHDLGLVERLKVMMHLAMCRHCRRYVAQLAKTVALLRRWPTTGDLPADLEERLVQRFRDRTLESGQALPRSRE
ncbi:MAG: anti-sigma factor [Geminicoccaceae bacterium]